MKQVADKMSAIKTTHEMPESLEEVDFEELKTEFEGMKDLATKFKNYDTNKLPDSIKQLDFTQIETDFTNFATKATQLADMP
jgi:hypothetical protein